MPYYRTFLSLLFVTGFAIGQTEIPGQERLPKTPVIDQDLANLADKISREKNSHVSQFAKPKLSLLCYSPKAIQKRRGKKRLQETPPKHGCASGMREASDSPMLRYPRCRWSQILQ